MKPHLSSDKVNYILNIILVFLLLIIFRVWHLSVLQHEEYSEKARRPQLREIIEAPVRGSIVDRFGHVLASNKLSYDAAISYNGIQQIPRLKIIKGPKGERIRSYPRKAYITKLSVLLGKELGLDAQRIEDVIYSKASIIPQVAYVIQEQLSERQYYRLKYLEKDYPGLLAQKKPKRFYPWGANGASVIGNIGVLNAQEYHNFYGQVKYLDELLSAKGGEAFLSLPKGIDSLSEAQWRYESLKEKAYRFNDFVGKSGVERSFDHELKGYWGKRRFISDAKGNSLKELPDSTMASSGKRLQLALSIELQKHCEELLIQSEDIREGMSRGYEMGRYTKFKQPWIKGGAIVAIDPKNGDILALASYPRLGKKEDNKQLEALKKLENEEYIRGLWEEEWQLEKEVYNPNKKGLQSKSKAITLDYYLQSILPKNSLLIPKIKSMSVQRAVDFQRAFYTLFAKSQERDAANFINALFPHIPSKLANEKMVPVHTPETLMKVLEDEPFFKEMTHFLKSCFSGIEDNYDKLLLLDLSRLFIEEEAFGELALSHFGPLSLADFRQLQNAYLKINKHLKSEISPLYLEQYFKKWREQNQKAFLKEKREKEKRAGRYAKPYLDYLDQAFQQQFQAYWEKNATLFIYAALHKGEKHLWPQAVQKLLGTEEALTRIYQQYGSALSTLKAQTKSFDLRDLSQHIACFRSFHELKAPLFGRYFGLRTAAGKQSLKDLAMAFYPLYGYGYSKSYGYQVPSTLGSIFKIVPSYAALKYKYFEQVESNPHLLKQLNPLEIIDQWTWQKKGDKKELSLGYFSNGSPIPRVFKKGRLPKSQRRNIGRVDVVKAIETSSNPYFSLLASEVVGGEEIYKTTRSFGFGEKTGVHLPGEVAGYVPKDIMYNNTALYSMAIGQHSLEVTPLQTGMMLAAFFNGGALVEPRVVKNSLGDDLNLNHMELFLKKHDSYQPYFQTLGLDFPLISVSLDHYEKERLWLSNSKVKSWIFMPSSIQTLLAEGMRRVVSGGAGCARKDMIREYSSSSPIFQEYEQVLPTFLGKTSTAECVERLDISRKAQLYNHIWFGTVAFDKKLPELSQLVLQSKPFTFYDKYGFPEICVVVFLRYGSFGREAAPLAASVIHKWREIKRGHQR